MEIVETSLTPLQRRAAAAWVPWRDLAAQQRRRGVPLRVLAPGEEVLVAVEDGSHRRGRVLRLVGSGSDGAYVITLGAPAGRTSPPAGVPGPRVQDVEVRVIPAQRGPVDLYL